MIHICLQIALNCIEIKLHIIYKDLYPLGSYCPEGSPAPISCPLGQYCELDELDTPTGNCSAGYFCNGGAVDPDPAECSLGHFCPSGTTIEVACEPGTFNSKLKHETQIVMNGYTYIIFF